MQRKRLEQAASAKAAKAESERIKFEAVKGEIEEKRAAEGMQHLINELSMEQQQLAVDAGEGAGAGQEAAAQGRDEAREPAADAAQTGA